jgi:Uma2 family endonuclease
MITVELVPEVASVEPIAVEHRRWTVEEYHRMIDAGILTQLDHVELINGEIVCMPPQGPAHSGTTLRSDKYLRQRLGGRADVRVQMPILLTTSEPEPDLAIVRVDERDYCDRHPQPEDIFLVIEISRTSLEFDRTTKANTYAKARILEYWVLDVVGRQVYAMSDPDPEAGKYRSVARLTDTDLVSPIGFPDLEIAIAKLLPLS